MRRILCRLRFIGAIVYLSFLPSAFGLVILAGVAAVGLTVNPADATIIQIGQNTGGNSIPFLRSSSAGGRYQQVYASSSFTGPVNISAVSFFANRSPTAPIPETLPGDYEFSLSTSNFQVNQLDLIDLDLNPGADAMQFAGPITFTSDPVPISFTIEGSIFTYDSANGDLLLDILISNTTCCSNGGSFEAMGGTANGLFSRAFDFPGTNFNNAGLVTAFEFEPATIPEPSTLVLFTVGLAGFGFVGWRRRKVVA